MSGNIKRDRLKAIREISSGLSMRGIACDVFKANRILNNLEDAYRRGIAEDPSLRDAVLNGEYGYCHFPKV